MDYDHHPSHGTVSFPPSALPPAHLLCPCCQGRRAILEPSLLGLMPVICDACDGTGRRTIRTAGARGRQPPAP